MNYKFKIDNPDVEERRHSCEQLLSKFPDKIPIICEKDPKSKMEEIDKTKYLVPGDLTITKFISMIRKRVKISDEAAFYLLIGGKSIAGDVVMKDIYNKYKDKDDGFLYCVYASELTWG